MPAAFILVDRSEQVLSIMTSPDEAPQPESTPAVPRYYSQLKKAHKERVVPELKEADLEESFVRGARYSTSVSYILLMRTIIGNRKWTWRTVGEQDGKQRPTVT